MCVCVSVEVVFNSRTVNCLRSLKPQDVFAGILDGFDNARQDGSQKTFGANGRKINSMAEESVNGGEVREAEVSVDHDGSKRG